MAETVVQYIERILSNVDGDPVAIQSATPQRLQDLVKDVPSAKLTTRPSPDRWSVAEILAHLADAELVVGFRLRKILSESGAPIQAYDQDAWATQLQYAKRDPQRSLKNFTLLREMNLELLGRLTEEEWERYGIHAERGKETIRQIVRLLAGHDVNHLKQIAGIVAK